MSFAVAEVLSSWLNAVLSFVDDDALPNANFLYDYYALLGASPDVCETLAHSLRMIWDGSALLLPVSTLKVADVLEKVSSCLLALLDFPSFSSSRWCAIGPACRSLTLALALGWDAMVQYALSMNKVTDDAANGYCRLTPDGKRFVVVCALSSVPAEAVLHELMLDPAVPTRVTELRALIAEEIAELETISVQCWMRLGSIVDMDFQEMKHAVLTSARVAAAYFEKKTLILPAPMSSLSCKATSNTMCKSLQRALLPLNQVCLPMSMCFGTLGTTRMPFLEHYAYLHIAPGRHSLLSNCMPAVLL